MPGMGRFLSAVVVFAVLAPAQTIQRSRSRHGEPVTFNRQVVRIFQRNCQTCHRPGEVAPFSLLDYPSARPWADAIRQAVTSGEMPPWKPVAGRFQDERVLSQQDIDLIAAWVDNGAPQGNAAHLPEPLEFSEDWTLGEPDLVLEMPAYTPDPAGEDDYRCFSLPAESPTGRKLRAAEIRPGNRNIVHHVILFPDPDGRSAVLSEAEPGPGYTCFGDPGFDSPGFLGGWAPGNRPREFPSGTAMTMSAGSRIAMQVHYHPDGTEQTDRTRVGLHFTDDQSAQEMFVLPLVNRSFVIPPGSSDYAVTAEFTTPFSGRIHSLLPHMHLLGREIQLEIFFPDGSSQTVIRIDDWEFEWQDTYWLAEPLQIPAGARLKLTCVYDNPGPDPVGWGERTVDEMALVFIGFTLL